MFTESIRTEPIPERIYELCRIVNRHGPMTSGSANAMMEPRELNTDSSPYFGAIRDAAADLGIIEKNGNEIKYIGPSNALESLDDFRKYCNKVLFTNPDTRFYRIVKGFLDSDGKLLHNENLTSLTSIDTIRGLTGLDDINVDDMRGSRFWLSFLGFCYIEEVSNRIYYLPNMYTALCDAICSSDLIYDKEYPVREFFEAMPDYIVIALKNWGSRSNVTLNLALSNGLRQLHDNGEISLRRNSDSKEVWDLYHNSIHDIVSISHILIKGDSLA